MSDHDARVLVSHLLSGDSNGGLGHSDVKELHKNLMLCVASVLSRYTAMRGISLLSIRLQHITVIDDPQHEMGFTFCIWLPKVKNNINGKNDGAYFPLVRNLRDGYLCPALHLAFWILFMEAEFTAVVQAHERSGDEGGWPCANPSSSSSGFSRIIAPLRARQRLMRFYSCQVRCIGGNSLITCRVGNCTLLYPLHALFPKLELRSYLQSVVSIGAPLPSAVIVAL